MFETAHYNTHKAGASISSATGIRSSFPFHLLLEARSYGRSHRPRQHEAFDCHAFKRNQQEMRPDAIENSQISPSTIVWAARAAGSHPHLVSVLLQGRKSANIQASSGGHPGNPGLDVRDRRTHRAVQCRPSLYGRGTMHRFTLIASVIYLFVAPALGQTIPKRDITPGVALTKVPAESVKCLSDLMGETLSADDPVTLTMICTQGYSKCIRNVPSDT